MDSSQISALTRGLSDDEIFLIDATLSGASQPQWNLYFSRVRFTTTVSTTPFVYTISAQKVSAFGYGVGQNATAGGLPLNATAADTSIQQAGATINAEYVLVRGVSIFLAPSTDPILAKQLDPVTAVTLFLGPTTYQLGAPSFCPSWGGFAGMSESMSSSPNLYEQFAKNIGGLSNGVPIAGNTQKFPRPIIWTPPGKGTFSNLTVQLQSQVSTIAPANTASADRTAGAAGVTYNGAPAAWTHPTAANTFVDYIVVLEHVPFYLS